VSEHAARGYLQLKKDRKEGVMLELLQGIFRAIFWLVGALFLLYFTVIYVLPFAIGILIDGVCLVMGIFYIVFH
jgi:hypothetical protein